MTQSTIDRLTSRKFIAFIVGIGAAVAYAFGVIDEKGLAGIIAAAGTYQIGEGLADLGQSKATIDAGVALEHLDRITPSV